MMGVKIFQYFMHMRAKSICEFWMAIEKGVMAALFLVRNETEDIPACTEQVRRGMACAHGGRLVQGQEERPDCASYA